MGAEYERKWKANGDILLQLENRWAGQFQTIRMETTYFDTPDGALSQMRCTLRSRLENDLQICTLKTPGTNGARGEWELESTPIQAAPLMLCKLSGIDGLSFLENAPLQPVCGARFIRKAALIQLPQCTLELALDEGVLTGKGKEEPLCEIEVEYKSGNRAQTDAFADTLEEAYSLVPEPRSKFARARALGQGDPYGLF